MEEAHSDDGSYELINFDDYESDKEHAEVSSDMGLSDGSYDFVSSEMSPTNGDASPVSEKKLCKEIDPFASGSANSDCEFTEEEEEENNEEDKGVSDCNFSVSLNKGKTLMAMVYEKSKFDKIRLREDVKINQVAKYHILRYLPAKCLSRSRLVSKEWNQWIKTPFFAHTQTQYFRKTSGFFQDDENGAIDFISLDLSAYGVADPFLSFLPQTCFIKSSCNGLLLCQSYSLENEYYVCNPTNKMWIQIPFSNYYHHGTETKYVLVFEPSSLDFEPYFQVVCPFSYTGGPPMVNFDIYDSKSKSWKISETICVDFGESEIKSDGIFVNGVVNWETTSGELLAFDPINEIYSVQAIPFGEGGSLSKVNGELTYVKPRYHNSASTCVLEVYGGGIMSLKTTISFDISCYDVEDCKVLGNSCDDVVAVIVKKNGGQNCLFVYHVKDEKVQGPKFLGVSSNPKLFPYVNSLVSLD